VAEKALLYISFVISDAFIKVGEIKAPMNPWRIGIVDFLERER
jgi:hypothetical protein